MHLLVIKFIHSFIIFPDNEQDLISHGSIKQKIETYCNWARYIVHYILKEFANTNSRNYNFLSWITP